jgi:predicted PurR-regulated permease PerM
MNWNDFLEKTYLASVKEQGKSMQKKEQGSVATSELQKTIEYLGLLKAQYQSEIRLLILGGVFFLFYVLVRELTTLVLASYLAALLFHPVLVKMNRAGISRGKGMLLVFSVFGVGILIMLWMLIPRLITESVELVKAVPNYAEGSFLKTKVFFQENFNLEIPSSGPEVKAFFASITEGKSFDNLKPVLEPLGNTLFAGYNLTLSFINLLLFPFLVFYIGRDWTLINEYLGKSLPASYRISVFPFLKEVQRVIVGYARGQALVSVLLMVAYSAGLLLIGVRFAFPLGVFAGALSVVPYLGFFTGFTLALIIQIVNEGTLIGILKLAGVFLAIQTVESNFVTPKVMSNSTGLHPLIVILSLIIGGTLFGFVGLILGIPGAAIIKLIIQRTLKPL